MDWQAQVDDVHNCMRFIRKYEGRWHHASKMGKLLLELVSVGDFPLPASPPCFPSGQKRPRDSEDAVDSGCPTTPTTASSSTTDVEGKSVSHDCIPDRTNCPFDIDHVNCKQEPLCFSDEQGPHLQSVDTLNPLNMETVSIPYQGSHISTATGNQTNMSQNDYSFEEQQPEPRPNEAHSAHDVLSALDSAYFMDSPPELAGGAVMDTAQQTFGLWTGAPSGFQWDEWQQLTSIAQSAPDPGISEGMGEPVYSWSQF